MMENHQSDKKNTPLYVIQNVSDDILSNYHIVYKYIIHIPSRI